MLRITCSITAALALTFCGASATAGTVDIHVDKTFSNDGVASLDVRGNDFAFSVVPDGKHYYLVGGTERDSKAPCAFLIARYDNRGRLDSAFGKGGVKTLTIGKQSCATSATLAPNGNLLVGGWSVGRKVEASVVAFRPNGSLDRSFGRNGMTRIPIDGGISSPRLEVEPDGSVWFAWSAIKNWDTYRGNYQVAHLRPNGSRDASFGDRGVRSFDVKDVDVVAETAVDAAGRFYVTGWSSPSLKQNGLAAVISVKDAKPTYQRTFNEWGQQGTYVISSDIDANGALVVGLTPYSVAGWGAMRMNDKLRLDNTFSGDGVAKHDCRCSSDTGVTTTDGILLIGTNNGRDNQTIVAHFTQTGTWDAKAARFGPWQAVDGWEFWEAAAVDDEGRIMLAGRGKNRTQDALIARLTLA